MKAKCGFCKGSGKNAMGVPYGKCAGSGEIEVASAPPAIATTKGATLQGEGGAFVISRGKPRYAFLQGKHLVVGRGKVEEFASIAAAYRRRDELLALEKKG